MPESNGIQQESDEDLVVSLQQGQDYALNILMERYKKPLFYFVDRYMQNEEDAYDILQETFIKLYEKSSTYKSSYKFKTWLYQIALNLCRDHHRKKKWKRFVSFNHSNDDDGFIDIEKNFSSGDDVERAIDDRQQLKKVGKDILALPHKLKSALILYAIEGHSQEKCASILGVSVKTVEMRIYRARKILSEKHIV